MKIIKPKLVLNKSLPYPLKTLSRWVCHDDYFMLGTGNSPKEAYDNWKKVESTRSRIPRRTHWNRRDCLDWYNRGCPTLRSYIGSKQIISYDFLTDELILRG